MQMDHVNKNICFDDKDQKLIKRNHILPERKLIVQISNERANKTDIAWHNCDTLMRGNTNTKLCIILVYRVCKLEITTMISNITICYF